MTDQKKININFPPEVQGGVYANNMFVTHTKEEFIMDFIMVAPPTGKVTARVISSPGHMKRILKALQENLRKYEEKFGSLKEAEEPKSNFGFQVPR
jgi:hypothetical protein